jgi:hypothetical protein
MASAKVSTLRFLGEIGEGPAPALWIISPQNLAVRQHTYTACGGNTDCWSPKNGTTIVGRPFRSAMAVVPAPNR